MSVFYTHFITFLTLEQIFTFRTILYDCRTPQRNISIMFHHFGRCSYLWADIIQQTASIHQSWTNSFSDRLSMYSFDWNCDNWCWYSQHEVWNSSKETDTCFTNRMKPEAILFKRSTNSQRWSVSSMDQKEVLMSGRRDHRLTLRSGHILAAVSTNLDMWPLWLNW